MVSGVGKKHQAHGFLKTLKTIGGTKHFELFAAPAPTRPEGGTAHGAASNQWKTLGKQWFPHDHAPSAQSWRGQKNTKPMVSCNIENP